MASRGPTGEQVARHANVSQSTVSLVLSGRAAGRVSARTQAAVVAAARELGYRPNAAARSLRSGFTGLVLLLLPDIRNPFHARVLAGAQSVAGSADRAIVLVPDAGRTGIDRLSTAVDGVLTYGVAVPAGSDIARVAAVTMEAAAAPPAVRVLLGTAAGMTSAVEHLRGLGHRRIAYLRAAGGGMQLAPRVRAFRRATAGLPVVERAEHPCTADAQRAALELFALPQRVTAIVCDDDLQAAGVYRAARIRGVAVPDELSVVAFGNTPAAGLLYPDLTTVELDGWELGRVGMRLLLDLIEGARSPRRTVLRAPLVPGRSTAPAQS